MELELDFTSPVLRQPCSPVLAGKHNADLVSAMWDLMEKENGIGLAANQVGLSKAIFVAVTSKGRIQVANPIVSPLFGETLKSEEGCLSLPGKSFFVDRPGAVRLRAVDAVTATKMDMEFEWPDTRVICHEFDHLCGGLIDSVINLW